MPAASSRAPSPAICRSAVDQVRSRHQSDHRQGARNDNSTERARDRRRGDRISLPSADGYCCICSRQLLAQSGVLLLRIDMSGIGAKRTFRERGNKNCHCDGECLRAGRTLHVPKMLLRFDITCSSDQNESRLIATTAWRKTFPKYASHFMLLCMCRVVAHPINP